MEYEPSLSAEAIVVWIMLEHKVTASQEHSQHAKSVLSFVQGSRYLEMVYHCNPYNAPIVGFVNISWYNRHREVRFTTESGRLRSIVLIRRQY